MIVPEGKRLVSKWYFGGIAATGAVCITHPLDLIKVHIQTQQAGKIGIVSQAIKIVKNEGFFALYNGLSASMLRQMMYSTTRFGIYEVGIQHLTSKEKKDISFIKKVLLAGFAGALGGFVGTPGEVVNVRMQNDIKLPLEKRRNYKHALDGLYKVLCEEGFTKVFSGASMATSRASVATIGQLAFYDEIKFMLLDTGILEDNSINHFLSSLTAGGIATLMTQPLDVMKTRQMNSKPGEFRNLWHVVTHTSQLGFFKGVAPAFLRLGPHTIIMFMFLEQLRLNFGDYVDA